MIDRRPFAALGGADHGWLKAKHHFSFADYQDPKRVDHGALRVWNDDEIAPNSGFPPHPHAEMEIITWMPSIVATGTKTRFMAGAPPTYILYRSALFRIVLRRMRIEATSTMIPSTLIAPRPCASASA